MEKTSGNAVNTAIVEAASPPITARPNGAACSPPSPIPNAIAVLLPHHVDARQIIRARQIDAGLGGLALGLRRADRGIVFQREFDRLLEAQVQCLFALRRRDDGKQRQED